MFCGGNSEIKNPECHIYCRDCETSFCNHCMGKKTKEEIANSEDLKCPNCFSFNTESKTHFVK